MSLILHDSSEITFSKNKVFQGDSGFMGTYVDHRTGEEHEVKGLTIHSSLTLSSKTGVPLGLVNQKMWSRESINRRRIIKSGKNFTRVPIKEKESFKWIEGVNSVVAEFDSEKQVHICDRDADMYELFFNCISFNTNFLVRGVHKRCTLKSEVKIFDKIPKTAPVGVYELKLPKTYKRETRTAKIKVRYYKVTILPSPGKSRDYPPVEVYVVSAKEDDPKREDHVDWKLLTNMPIISFEEALEKVNWYKLRWNIEVFFKTLKFGFGVQRSRLRNLDRIKKYIAFTSVLAWRIFWISKISRGSPEAQVDKCFTKEEKTLLIKVDSKAGRHSLDVNSSLSDFVKSFARLGGYLARNSDPPPGQQVLWRAMMRFNDIQLVAPYNFVGKSQDYRALTLQVLIFCNKKEKLHC